MFRSLMDFSYQRTPLQALGWYLLYFFIGMVVGGVSANLFSAGATSFSEGLQHGVVIGQRVAIIYTIVIGILLLWRRPKGVVNIVLAVVGVGLSPLLGSLGGLIPLAVLTTRAPDPSAKVLKVFE